MVIGVALFVVAVLIIAVWLLIEIKRFKHKIFALFLIGLIIFGYISFTIVFSGSEVDLKSFDGLMAGGKMYVSWLGSVFVNFKGITANAVNMDWKGNNKPDESEE